MRCRGTQLHSGATAANNPILWFLHADSWPAVNSATTIRDHTAAGAVGGYFRFRFLGPRGWFKRLLEWTINARSGVGIPYGDQGLFTTAAAYEHTGGFARQPLFEEVQLVKQLRKSGSFIGVAATIGVSPRRWERDGWLRRTVENRLLALGHALGISPYRLARVYQRPANLDIPTETVMPE